MGKNKASYTANRRTFEFTPEDICFSSFLFAFAYFEEIFSRVLKNMIGQQTIHYVFDTLEW